jgi:hypothetical protein
MANKMTPQEWLNKANYEGGIYEGFTYGIRACDVDDSDPEFKALLGRAEIYALEFERAEDALLDYADDIGYNVE